MNFCVVNLGCKVNRVESDTYISKLLACGYTQSPLKEAHVILINTCTVTGEAEKKTRKALRQALRANDEASLWVTGCSVAVNVDYYTEISPRISVYSKIEMTEKLDNISTEHTLKSYNPSGLYRVGQGFHKRVGVKVQDGCDNACSFCIVHVARGRATSRPLDEIREECLSLARAGVAEIVLTGINLGSYCFVQEEYDKPVRLADLLSLLLKDTETISSHQKVPVRFRVSSIEPRDVDDDLINLLAASNGRICRHLHLPLQSGSAKVLREMARPYKIEEFCQLVDKLRSKIPTIALSTDVIVGFPGETREDFENTLDVVQACRFSRVHVFPYSLREGTPAALRDDQIPVAEKHRRATELRSKAKLLRLDELAARCGSVEYAVVEADGRVTTESYFSLLAPSGSKPGEMVSIRFDEDTEENTEKARVDK